MKHSGFLLRVSLVVSTLIVAGRPAPARADVVAPGAAGTCKLLGGCASSHAGERSAIAISPGGRCRVRGARGVGQRIDVERLSGPAGRSGPAVDPAHAPSLDDVATFCTAHPDFDAAPPLLALPARKQLPSWCDEAAAFAQAEAACGPLPAVVVSADANPADADGSAAAPFASIAEALAACDGPCHVLVAPGRYPESFTIESCTVIEGGVAVVNGVATSGASRPRIEGFVSLTGSDVVLARVDIEGAYAALSVEGDALVTESVLRGGYQAGSGARGTTGPRICASNLAGGYGGFDLAWGSSRLWIAGSAISACYEGAALSWGSSDLRVLGSTIYGHYHAVGTSWGSFSVDVRGSRLRGAHAAVDIHIAPNLTPGPDGTPVEIWPESFDVDVVGNRVHGALPASDARLGIRVHGNVVE